MPGNPYFQSIDGVPVIPASRTFHKILSAGSSTLQFDNAFIDNSVTNKKYEIWTDKDELGYIDIYQTGTQLDVTFAPQITDTHVWLIVTNL